MAKLLDRFKVIIAGGGNIHPAKVIKAVKELLLVTDNMFFVDLVKESLLYILRKNLTEHR